MIIWVLWLRAPWDPDDAWDASRRIHAAMHVGNRWPNPGEFNATSEGDWVVIQLLGGRARRAYAVGSETHEQRYSTFADVVQVALEDPVRINGIIVRALYPHHIDVFRHVCSYKGDHGTIDIARVLFQPRDDGLFTARKPAAVRQVIWQDDLLNVQIAACRDSSRGCPDAW